MPILLEEYSSIRQINLEIKNYYEEVWKEWDELLQKHEDEFDFERLAKITYQGDVTELTLTDGLTYEVLYNKNGLLSMKFDRYVYLGGPHGSPIRYCVVYDLNTAAKLKLHEVLPMSFAELMQQIEERLKIQYEQDWMECYENIQAGASVKGIVCFFVFDSGQKLIEKKAFLVYNKSGSKYLFYANVNEER